MTSRRGGNRRLDNVHEIVRGANRFLGAHANNLAGDLPGELLLTVHAKNASEVCFVICVYDLSCVKGLLLASIRISKGASS